VTPERLKEIEGRARAATAGPWGVEQDDLMWQLFGGDGMMALQLAKCPKSGTPYAEYWPNEADSSFIAHARTDVPALVAEVERLRAILLREACT